MIAGLKDAERWRRRVKRAFADPARVHITPEFDPLALAAGSDLLALPSRREPCGLVVLEALATGTPVLVGAGVGAREVLESPEQGEVLAAKVRVSALAGRLEGWLDRIEAGDPDREHIASAVAGRGLERWMSSLEEELLAARGSTSVE